MVKRHKNAGLELSIEIRETAYGCQLGSCVSVATKVSLTILFFYF